MKLVIVFAVVLLFTKTLVAQDSYENDIQFTKPISVDGDYQQKRLSATQRMKKMRKMLERQTERMVQKQIEKERLRAVLEERKNLIKMFNKNMKALDTIQ